MQPDDLDEAAEAHAQGDRAELAEPVDVDVDGDGVAEGWDCDDLDATVSPNVAEIRCNERDENCNGVDDCDRDGDGMRDADDPLPDEFGVGELPARDSPRWP